MQDEVHDLQVSSDFALRLIEGLVESGIDVAACSHVENPLKAGFGHAYGFVVKRLFGGQRIPILPVLLNTYFPPNVPSAARCNDIGVAMKRD